MTSPVTNKNFKIGDFEKTYVSYVAMAEKPLSSGQKWFRFFVSVIGSAVSIETVETVETAITAQTSHTPCTARTLIGNSIFR